MPPWGTPLGGNIGIHGYGRRRDRAREHAAGRDWTDGCIAVTNEEIERIADHIRVGTRVIIVP
jgi:lipoprotein-anchoring transpeptidase ErfK/SrfK